MKLEVLDTTLRDGAQGENISFSVGDKIKIVHALDRLGVDYIEAGIPASNPKDEMLFGLLEKETLLHAKIVAFASTVKKGINIEDDKNIAATLAANTPAVSLFGKAHLRHTEDILGITGDENIDLVKTSVAYFARQGREVLFDAEHFFDGYRDDKSYALSVLRAAKEAGAVRLVLCDTNGGMLPDEIAEIVREVKAAMPDAVLGIHCHNDSGCAIASTVLAATGGTMHVQGSFGGIGERCGNADLTAVLPNLILKRGFESSIVLTKLKGIAGQIGEIANIRIHHNAPYIGRSAFSHKGGTHVDAEMKKAGAFMHIDPSLVGNESRLLLSEVSGRSTVLPYLQAIAPHLTKQSEETKRITQKLKEQELLGYQYEGAGASFELLVKKELGLWKPHFNVIMYKLSDDYPEPDEELLANATVKIEANGKTALAAGEGNGPMNALYQALSKALASIYPELVRILMVDFKVRVIESKSFDAKTRVLIEATNGIENFTTIGVSTDMIKASFSALVDAYEYHLSKGDNI